MIERVVVYMSTYNGKEYLKTQIESILEQKLVDVVLIIRDDGSSDGTSEILKQYECTHNNVIVYYGQNLGYANSFLTLLLDNTQADYYAFADQDDFWEDDKLSSAIEFLKSCGGTLYASTLNVVDENLKFIEKKDFPAYTGTIGSTLSRNRLAGCTMVFNRNLKIYLSKNCNKIISFNNFKYGHDGWTILMCLMSGGKIVLDKESHISYRRHIQTITSVNGGIKKRLKNEYTAFLNRDNKRIRIASFLLSIEPKCSEYFYCLYLIANYKKNMSCRIRLLLSKEINTGVKLVDLINKIAILLGRY